MHPLKLATTTNLRQHTNNQSREQDNILIHPLFGAIVSNLVHYLIHFLLELIYDHLFVGTYFIIILLE